MFVFMLVFSCYSTSTIATIYDRDVEAKVMIFYYLFKVFVLFHSSSFASQLSPEEREKENDSDRPLTHW